MSRYFQAMERRKTGLVPYADSRTRPLAEVATRSQPLALVPILEAQGLLDALAASRPIRNLSEQLGAASAYNGPARILMTGCRAGDGVSTVAAAMALDLSQRLAARTMLVEGQSRVSAMHPLFGRPIAPTPTTALTTSIAVQGTGWPRLETARPEQMEVGDHPARMIEEMDELLARYRLAVIDLGVVRLDPRMLALARPNDPILVVARHLRTDRAELIATVNLLRNTGHPVAGVILNGYKSPLPALVRRLIGMEA